MCARIRTLSDRVGDRNAANAPSLLTRSYLEIRNFGPKEWVSGRKGFGFHAISD